MENTGLRTTFDSNYVAVIILAKNKNSLKYSSFCSKGKSFTFLNEITKSNFTALRIIVLQFDQLLTTTGQASLPVGIRSVLVRLKYVESDINNVIFLCANLDLGFGHVFLFCRGH